MSKEINHPYCRFVQDLNKDNLHKQYHDFRYGFRITDDNELFGRLLLEINQAGLSWDIILKKEVNFRKAFDNFDVSKIAAYTPEKVEELLNNKGIIRNKLKVNAALHNAQRVLEIQDEFGSFYNWLSLHEEQELTKQAWTKLFKGNFKFTGGEIVGEFLMSTGFMPGAHDENCEIYSRINNTLYE
ncbi:DNA-3-methyladenine glycosylase I [Lishizhenia tianjinensis]|uniref:DNA-3-methyladenine glycosylase I n=1 Tax=Lishizhenia tianjinensis TaxID=477690 RepID=A0A1I7AFH7_9FLAO|nr:DNA-3-methyladenine glycosylase I [Lishizhenia tianjinensis]SFT73673.1 DNA-3-methyladenine glycosylase I [Lishizhenia tianjinensis]